MQLLQLVTFIECELGMVCFLFFSRTQHGSLGSVVSASVRCVPNEVGEGKTRNILLKYVNLQWNETRGMALALTLATLHNNARTDCISLCLIVRKDSIKVNSKLGEWDPWGLAECFPTTARLACTERLPRARNQGFAQRNWIISNFSLWEKKFEVWLFFKSWSSDLSLEKDFLMRSSVVLSCRENWHIECSFYLHSS